MKPDELRARLHTLSNLMTIIVCNAEELADPELATDEESVALLLAASRRAIDVIRQLRSENVNVAGNVASATFRPMTASF